MTKLTNGAEYCNDKFPAEFAEYLIQNGFSAVVTKDAICFHKDRSIKLFVKHDHIDLLKIIPDSEGFKLAHQQSHSGIAQLNIFGWIMLMHVMGVITIRQFLNNAEKADKQLATEARSIINSVLQFQIPTVNFQA